MAKVGRKSTLETIAQLAKVSPGAVSVALSGRLSSTLRLNKETRANIIRLAQQLNYRPHAGARAARLHTFYNIGIVLVSPYHSNACTIRTFPPYLIHGINDGLLEQNYCLSFVQVARLPVPDTERWPRLLAESRVDGLIVTSAAPTELQDFIVRAKLPAVWVNTNLHEDHDCIYLDDFASARLATRYLAQQGHRRIIFLQPPSNIHYSSEDRHAGYVAEMESLHLEPYPGHDYLMPDHEAEAFIRNLLLRPDRPTAVLDGGPPWLTQVAYDLRLRIPDDLSHIIWVHDREEAELRTPPHTALITNEYQMGRLAAEMMLEKVANGGKQIKSKKLPLVFHEGRSAAPWPNRLPCH